MEELYHDGPPHPNDLSVTEQPLRPLKAECPYGHEYTTENRYFNVKTGRFYCRECRRLNDRVNAIHREKIGFSWNAEARSELLRHLGLKHSASWIAEDMTATFGHKISRNAVLGKLFRMGLSNPKPQVQDRPRKPRAKRLAIGDRGWQAKPRLEKPVEPIPVMDDSNIPLEQRRQIHELGDGMCRFPVGDPAEHETFFFCGGEIEARSYCRTHYQRCYGRA